MTFKYLLSVVCSLLITSYALAAPAITDGTGTATDGNTVTINGSGFGSNSIDIQWLGDNIEAGTNRADLSTPTNWGFVAGESSTMAHPEYSIAQAHSGSKSLYCPAVGDSNGASCAWYYQKPAKFSQVYFTFWFRWSELLSSSQWKVWRIRPITSLYVNDIPSEEYQNFYTSDPYSQLFLRPYQSSSDSYFHSGIGDVDGAFYLHYDTDPDMLYQQGAWCRIEVDLEAGTPGSMNGTYIVTITTPTYGITPTGVNYSGNVMTHESGHTDPQWQRVVFQNYGIDGNDSSSGGTINTGDLLYFDDIFIQFGSRARVEIGNASTWAACTVRDIQIPLVWADGQIQFTVNQGADADLSNNYIYIVNDDGSVNSNGFAVSALGGDALSPTFSSASANSTLFTFNFSETVVTTGYDSGDCVATGSSTGAHSITSLSGSGSSRTATLASGVEYGETITLSCTLSTDDIEDASGNDMITFGPESVTNNTPMTGFRNLGSSLTGCKIE